MKNFNRFSRKLAGIIAAGAMCAALPLSTYAAELGDVNIDGSVSVKDVVLLQKYLLKQETLSQEAFTSADLTADGKVNVFDLLLLKKQLIGGTVTPQPTPGGSTVVASIEYSASGVTLYDAEGGVVAADAASNVTVNNTYVTITAGGEFTVSGECANGQLKVNTDDDVDAKAAVTLEFTGLTLSNSTEAPVYVENVGKDVTISVKNKTVNTISDGTTHTDTYTNSSGEVKEINSAIFARDDLKIKGKGTLVVNGNFEDGLVCKNDLKIWNGTIEVNAKDDGIKGGNSVRIGDPDNMIANGGDGDFSNLNITVKTEGGDGIKSTETDEGKGFVRINGGTININSYADGIQAEQDFEMNGGDLTIYTYEGSNYTGSGSSSGSTGGWGGFGGGMQDGNSNKPDISAKGIKSVGLYDESGTTWQSGGNITINAGTIKIDSSDDSVHCGGDMNIYGGNFTIASADDGFHSDHELNIGKTAANTFDDVQIYISKCYEGVEGVTINQNSGTVYVISGDDGYNAAGGSDGSGSGNQGGPGGGWGQGGMSSSSGTMNLNGGLVVVNSASGDHDAFDSNGALNINGGYYLANGQESIDADGTISYNGGSVITMTAGNTNLNTRYSFLDNNGNVIVSFLSASGNPGQNCTNCTAYSGGTVSGGSDVLIQAGDLAVTVGGTLSNGTQITSSSSSGGNQGGPGNRW